MSSSLNYLIIHGHFYQPPRENPWIDEIERQIGASPYHDWNEKIAAECYIPNSVARILGDQQKIVNIVNNYEKISFNIGPTLLNWIKKKIPKTYHAILQADKRSPEQFSGHGNAIAQVYNHIILPLANDRDKITQVKWGLEDFKYHFKRTSESIWLAETAVNYPTIRVLIDEGIKFIILSPFQAQRVRPLKKVDKWTEVSTGNIDTSQPYRCYLIDHDGKKDQDRFIDIFFYHADLSKSVAFEHLLKDAKVFTTRIRNAFNSTADRPHLISICTDGESYGHHEHFGDMGLAYLLHVEAGKNGLTLTNYAEYLEKQPPEMEVELKTGPGGEGTAWSCSHGVGRWYRNCGCSTGGPPEWNQEWRTPLRKALDKLRDDLSVIFENEGMKYLHDPWRARDDYINIILDRSDESIEKFMGKHAKISLASQQKSVILNLLEMQRHAMLMYTSCGWFFADISGLEVVQILKYAAMSIEIGKKFSNSDFELKFLSEIQNARSNIPRMGNGKEIYENYVKPSIVTIPRLVNHYAILSTLEGFDNLNTVYHFDVKRHDYDKHVGAEKTLLIGNIEISSKITREQEGFAFVLLFRPNEEYKCIIKSINKIQDYGQTKSIILNLFKSNEINFWQELKKLWKEKEFSVTDILFEDREKLYNVMLEEKITRLKQDFWHIYQNNRNIIFKLNTEGHPIPDELRISAELGLSSQLTDLLKDAPQDINVDRAMEIIHTADTLKLNLNKNVPQKYFQQILDEKIIRLYQTLDQRYADELLYIMDVSLKLKLVLNESHLQNYLFFILRDKLPSLIENVLKKNKTDTQYKLVNSIIRLAYQFNLDITKFKQKLKPLEEELSKNPDFWP